MAPTNEELQRMGEIKDQMKLAKANTRRLGCGGTLAEFPKFWAKWRRHSSLAKASLIFPIFPYDRAVYNIQHSCRFLKNSIPESTSAQEVEAKALLRRGCDSKMC